MARELGDVLHYFLPEASAPPLAAAAGAGVRAAAAVAPSAAPPEPPHPPAAAGLAAAPIVCVPVASHDVVRSALLWNLAVEIARQGARVRLVAPASARAEPWPRPGRGPLGLEVVEAPGDDPAALAGRARCPARPPIGHGADTALALAAAPPPWLRRGAEADALLRWVVLLARPDERDLRETRAALGAVAERAPDARLGICVFGVRSLGDARRAFEGLAVFAEHELGRPLLSYGVLVDDVHLSRSIVSQRPIALTQPASTAARALADVAAMLLADAAAPAADDPA